MDDDIAVELGNGGSSGSHIELNCQGWLGWLAYDSEGRRSDEIMRRSLDGRFLSTPNSSISQMSIEKRRGFSREGN